VADGEIAKPDRKMKKIIPLISAGITCMVLVLTSCRPASISSVDGLNILASTSFLADIARNVAGDRAQVNFLIPAGADPHEYQPAPSDVARIAESTVLILNGLDYEGFIQPLLDNAGGERLIITASTGLQPRPLEEAPGVGSTDPHMWLDPNRVIRYVENIRDGLTRADAQGAEVYKANAEAYIVQLRELDAWIVGQVNTIPAEHRLLVTNHEAVGYFADRYGFIVVATVIPAMSTDAGTSARELAAVIDQIKAGGAPAIFLGEVENPDLANQIAAETGVMVVDDLYLESLSDGAPAGTYIDMMKHNVTRIVGALK
jgi:ABC-type Zn uptake system ZnuABC Zn-binding protein ZnuA